MIYKGYEITITPAHGEYKFICAHDDDICPFAFESGLNDYMTEQQAIDAAKKTIDAMET
ncbi:MAG TPA: hypothetical protein VK616_12635 [Flavitalea sp.]|nr:hypothetical protein [Flavitalea sp.]